MRYSDLLKVMQLADSSLPTGGYAFSGGLEWMIKSGSLASLEDLNEYWQGMVYQLIQFDLPFIASIAGGSMDEAGEAAAEYDLMMRIPGIRKASVSQGRAWMRLLPQLYSAAVLEEVDTTRKEWQIAPLFLIVLSLTFSQWKNREFGIHGNAKGNSMIPWRELASVYTYMAVRDQVSAAVRLGAIGPSAAVKLQRDATAYAGDLIEKCPDCTYKDAVRTGSVPEIAVSSHDRLYSRLFQN